MDGEHKVTLAIFSGVPDPVWWVHSRHESFERITEHLHRVRTTTKTYRHEHMPPILGYRGFLVHPPQAKKAELFVGQETKELQKLLLGSMPKDLIPDALRQKILHAIESTSMPHPASVAHQAQTPSRQKVLQAPSIGEKAVERIPHYAPQLNLPRWNTYDLIRSNNNCYDYANDKITNSFAQPGTASGHPYPRPITPEGVLTAAQSDGLVKLDVPPSAPCPEAPEQPNCLVALLVAPGVDYHFYRLDDNGLWSQKLGQTAATNHDGDGNLISDPRTAVNLPFGPDYKFVSFMMIFTNIIDGPLGPHPSTNE